METEHEPHLVTMRVADVYRGPAGDDQPRRHGFHQICAVDLPRGMIGLYSRTGDEGIRDDLRAGAWHAQPFGL
jgi:hypothetical protein